MKDLKSIEAVILSKQYKKINQIYRRVGKVSVGATFLLLAGCSQFSIGQNFIQSALAVVAQATVDSLPGPHPAANLLIKMATELLNEKAFKALRHVEYRLKSRSNLLQ